MATATTDHFGLSGAFYLFAILNLLGAVLAFVAIQKPQPMRMAAEACVSFAAWIDRLRNPAVLCCLGVGSCILFAFIGTFTYINFVLVMAPFDLGMMSLGLIYFVFLPSIVTTPFGGQIARRFGERSGPPRLPNAERLRNPATRAERVARQAGSEENSAPESSDSARA